MSLGVCVNLCCCSSVLTPSLCRRLSWVPLDGTVLALSKLVPLNGNNIVAANLTSGGFPGVSLANYGFWGMNIEDGQSYALTLYANDQSEVRDPDQFWSVVGAEMKPLFTLVCACRSIAR